MFWLNEKYFDDENINEANLFLFNINYDCPIKELWEDFYSQSDTFDGLEIPIRMNWHNGNDYNDYKNYFSVHLIAIYHTAYYYFNTFKYSMTSLRDGSFSFLKKEIGQLIYSQKEVIDNQIIALENGYELKSMRHYDDFDRKQEKLYIVGFKLVQFKKKPYFDFVDVIGPKETFFLKFTED